MNSDCNFADFVAIRLNDAPPASIEFKSLKSFRDSTRGNERLPLQDLLKIWIVSMVDRGMTVASRKRYAAKLRTIYKEYIGANDSTVNPFNSVKSLLNCEFNCCCNNKEALTEQNEKLRAVFKTLVQDAKSRPSLAVFLYLLFNASSDMESAVMLRTDGYTPKFAQLDDIIDLSSFHQRRRYIFDLAQSRKRIPQLVREVTTDIEHYFISRGLKFANGFSALTISAMWITEAREAGISLPEIRTILTELPGEYAYLDNVHPSDITSLQSDSIKRRVADAFLPSTKRWYAMKLKRGVDYDDIIAAIKENMPDSFSKIEFFYPTRELVKRDGKKIIREKVPYIPDIVFFNVLPRHVGDIDRCVRLDHRGWVFRTVNTANGDYSIIANESMLTFERAVGRFSSDMKIEMTDRSPVSIGREVRITGGVMAGYKGIIHDIKNGDDQSGRQLYIKLSASNYVKIEVKVDETYIEAIS